MKKILVYFVMGILIISNIASATILAVSAESRDGVYNSNDIVLLTSSSSKEENKNTQSSNDSGITLDFWGQASSWFEKGDPNGSTYGDEIIKKLEDMVLVLGTTVIVLATIILGIKFMFGSVEAKADVKEGLLNLLVACVFFFGWNSIKTLLFPGNNFIFINDYDTTYRAPIARVFSIATYIAQFVAIIAIIYVGIRYIFAGVQGRTELKEKSGTFIIGIILAFCSTGVLTYISKVINEALAK